MQTHYRLAHLYSYTEHQGKRGSPSLQESVSQVPHIHQVEHQRLGPPGVHFYNKRAVWVFTQKLKIKNQTGFTSVLTDSLEGESHIKPAVPEHITKILRGNITWAMHLCHLLAFPVTQGDNQVKDLSNLLP